MTLLLEYTKYAMKKWLVSRNFKSIFNILHFKQHFYFDPLSSFNTSDGFLIPVGIYNVFPS